MPTRELDRPGSSRRRSPHAVVLQWDRRCRVFGRAAVNSIVGMPAATLFPDWPPPCSWAADVSAPPLFASRGGLHVPGDSGTLRVSSARPGRFGHRADPGEAPRALLCRDRVRGRSESTSCLREGRPPGGPVLCRPESGLFEVPMRPVRRPSHRPLLLQEPDLFELLWQEDGGAIHVPSGPRHAESTLSAVGGVTPVRAAHAGGLRL